HEPVPERLTRTVRDAGKGRPEWRRRIAMPVAASLAALVIGVGAGYLGGAQWSSDGVQAAESERWLDDIASFHLLYAREERHLVEVGADRSDELQAWLGKHLHRDLRIPDLSAPGFTFEGGRLLMSGGKPLAQLLYLPPEGRPLGLCITV
ncbi:MAG: anti-sigma factor, partial [Gemmatimonadetes bacterium]|nr:anti-sigma factor [Gemmatimonadota bacterium]